MVQKGMIFGHDKKVHCNVHVLYTEYKKKNQHLKYENLFMFLKRFILLIMDVILVSIYPSSIDIISNVRQASKILFCTFESHSFFFRYNDFIVACFYIL